MNEIEKAAYNLGLITGIGYVVAAMTLVIGLAGIILAIINSAVGL